MPYVKTNQERATLLYLFRVYSGHNSCFHTRQPHSSLATFGMYISLPAMGWLFSAQKLFLQQIAEHKYTERAFTEL